MNADMIHDAPLLSTGMPGLDEILHGLLPGDNLVWQIDNIAVYQDAVERFASHAAASGVHLHYFRFAAHPPLLSASPDITVHSLNPKIGFEQFVTAMVDEIEPSGGSAWYVFDCLSQLADDWYSDRMLANFFLVICPYVLRLGSLAYFALLKKTHSQHATDCIFSTAQIIMETYHQQQVLYLQPQKVDHRHSPTMFSLHALHDGRFLPVTNSAIISDIHTSQPSPLLDFTIHRHGSWTRSFYEAQLALDAISNGEQPPEHGTVYFERLLRMIITREKPFINLARKYFTLEMLIDILKRLIGSGLIGGKARGMLLAHAILRQTNPKWASTLEPHDSFYIGSDVFYTYIIQNDCWWLRRKTGAFPGILERARVAQDRIRSGEFLPYIKDQFREMLEYFGQSPIIVRSSSLLEDNYGNAFSGKYESIFLANHGTIEERFDAFLNAVKHVYASTLNEDALQYRLHHGLLFHDEQMALLVQRVSGTLYDSFFFPACAGVGFSYNPYVWDNRIDPHAGLLRLAFGLGTHAVEQVEDDYTRLVALSSPALQPEPSTTNERRYTQHYVDVIDLNQNGLLSHPVAQAFAKMPANHLQLFVSHDQAIETQARSLNLSNVSAWKLTFDNLFSHTPFIADIREMLASLQNAYDSPVDIEFTVNVQDDTSYRINIVQCRPFQVRIIGTGELRFYPANISDDHVVFETNGPIIGQSTGSRIDRLIYVVPSSYIRLSVQDQYALARLIGRITHISAGTDPFVLMILGPGRWGTSTPAMGIPVSFKEIKTVSVISELAVMHEGLVPEVSLGTHFFNDLVEMDMLYLAVFPERPGNRFNESFLLSARNWLTDLLPDAASWQHVVKVLDFSSVNSPHIMNLHVDSLTQHGICYVKSVDLDWMSYI